MNYVTAATIHTRIF